MCNEAQYIWLSATYMRECVNSSRHSIHSNHTYLTLNDHNGVNEFLLRWIQKHFRGAIKISVARLINFYGNIKSFFLSEVFTIVMAHYNQIRHQGNLFRHAPRHHHYPDPDIWRLGYRLNAGIVVQQLIQVQRHQPVCMVVGLVISHL